MIQLRCEIIRSIKNPADSYGENKCYLHCTQSFYFFRRIQFLHRLLLCFPEDTELLDNEFLFHYLVNASV